MKELELSVRSYVDMLYQIQGDYTENHFDIKDAFMFGGRHPFWHAYDKLKSIANRNTGILELFERTI